MGEVCWKILLLKLGGVRAKRWTNVVLAEAVLRIGRSK